MLLRSLRQSFRENEDNEERLLEKNWEDPEMLEEPEEQYIEEYSSDTVMHWNAPEFELTEKDPRRLAYAALALLAIIGYATYTNNPIMAITFVLIGIVIYMHLHRQPRNLDFRIVPEGILAGKDLYHFSDIRSFWIFYEPGYKKVISLHTTSYLSPFVSIPIHEENPTEIREKLLKHIPEIKQEPGLADLFERFLGL